MWYFRLRSFCKPFLPALIGIVFLLSSIIAAHPGFGQEIREISTVSNNSRYVFADTAAMGIAMKHVSTMINRHPRSTDTILPVLDGVIHSNGVPGSKGYIMRAYYLAGNYYSEVGENVKATRMLNYLIEQNRHYSWRSINDSAHFMSKVHFTLGRIYYNTNKFDAAAAQWLLVLRLQDQFPDIARMGPELHNCLGVCFARLNQNEQAISYFERAFKDAGEQHKTDVQSSSLVNMGSLFVENYHQPKKGLVYFKKALSITPEQNERALQMILLNIGEAYISMDSSDLAIPYLEQAIHLSAENINKIALIRSQTELGEAYYKLGRLDNALNQYSAALKLLEGSKNLAELAVLHRKMADAYTGKGFYKSANEHLTAAMLLNDSLSKMDKVQSVSLQKKLNAAELDRNTTRTNLVIAQRDVRIRERNVSLVLLSAAFIFITLVLTFLFRSFKHKRQVQESKIQMLEQEKEIVNLQAIMNGEEKERERISRDLHDGIGGMLASLKMQISALQVRHKASVPQKEFEDTLQTLDETADEVRKTSHNLMPQILVEYGLETAFQLYCDRLVKGNKFSIDFQCIGLNPQLDQRFQLTLYRILQELMQNIIKHAEATSINVFLNQHEDVINVMVEDNGIGMSEDNYHTGMGLATLQSKVKSMFGTLEIESFAGKGTTVHIEFNVAHQHTS